MLREDEADGGVCVWVVGSSWLMMLLIRGMSTVSEGRGKAKGNRLTWDLQDELDDGETEEDGGEGVHNPDEGAVRIGYTYACVSRRNEG